MCKKIMAFFLILFVSLTVQGQLQSPEKFLGYSIGSRYTPHWLLMEYYKHVATEMPLLCKLMSYGTTNEQRPLKLAFVSSQENIKQLEEIRKNNLRLAGILKDNVPLATTAPAIVWLSYNVHGNETSSSEAALLTIYELLSSTKTSIKDWLKKVVVVIDPCMNPDGRDRYVNWFNGISGTTPNSRLEAREHREPWPGGRTNHYNFDLNRDWAWQTQVESQQRALQYLQWMPQVHVDFHEQGINQPYYFAPAAQPYHETITKWQRDFQLTIGKNHAKKFDEKGWLYFTKEIFDLLYPSYGDTYPVYNGSVGMTYEQGGGPSAGILVDTDEGDSLSLFDRVIHHHTTGLSTIEVAAENNTALIKEYQQFFSNANSGSHSVYKSFIIKTTPAQVERITALLKLLTKNGIQYYPATNINGQGFSYQTGKEESFSCSTSDIIIPVNQPRGNMVKVLFEPQTKLVDSLTYDITAWSLPYAYGVTAFASKQLLPTSGTVTIRQVNNTALPSYGYVLRWQGIQSAKALSQLLQQAIRVRYAEEPFETGGEKFDRGSIIILKKGNEKHGDELWKKVNAICNQANVALTEVKTGMMDVGYDFGSGKVHPLKQLNIVLLTGEGISAYAAGEVWHFFEKELRYPITLVNANDAGRIKWANTDVIIMPDGHYSFFNNKQQSDQLANWLREGGKIIALESAVAALSKQEWSLLKAKKMDDSTSQKDDYKLLKTYENREKDEIQHTTPGAILKVDIDNSHPLMYGYSTPYYSLKMDNTVYDFMKEGGWNVGVIKKSSPIAGFIGNKLKSKLQDGLLFGAQEVGRGSVVYFTDNVLFRNFWENGKLMFSNAVFLVGE
jgi:hypothetical protein